MGRRRQGMSYVIAHSFHQFQFEKRLPVMEREAAELEAQAEARSRASALLPPRPPNARTRVRQTRCPGIRGPPTDERSARVSAD